MPRFRPNSTLPRSNYKPKNIDMTRNKDASCTVCIPFGSDVQLGHNDRIVSIDCLSLLTGSDTFNKLAQVFDEFKIQKYHCCIDLQKPSYTNIKGTWLFSPEYTDDFFKGQLKFSLDGAPYVSYLEDAQFYEHLRDALVTVGFINYDENTNTITRNFAGTEGNDLYWLELVYRLLMKENVAINYSDIYSNIVLDGSDADHTGDYYSVDGMGQQDELIGQFTVTIGNNDDSVLNDDLQLDDSVANYQIIGACALRQVPKGFYCQAQTEGETIFAEIPAMIAGYNVGLGNVEDMTDEQMESVGNYIHDPYMPGASVHLSLEVVGTSATEKSIYTPTSVVKDISAVDSFNQIGRFLPVGLLHNKVRAVNDPREVVSGGTFFDQYVEKLNSVTRANDSDAGLYEKIEISFATADEGHTLNFSFYLYLAPVRRAYNQNFIEFVPTGVYTTFGYYGLNDNNHYVADDQEVSFNDFISRVHERVEGGSYLYNMIAPPDIDVALNGCAFSIQSYVTCRFRQVRNNLGVFNYVYPYGVVDYEGKNIFYDENDRKVTGTIILNDHSLAGVSKALIKNTCFIRKRTEVNNEEVYIPANLNQCNRPIKFVSFGNAQGMLCHKIVKANAFMFGYLNANGGEIDDHDHVLYGFACQVNPDYPNDCFIFNITAFNGLARANMLYTINNLVGASADQPLYTDEIFHVFYIVMDDRTQPDNPTVVAVGQFPTPASINVGVNDPRLWNSQYWGICISRMRSYGIVDGEHGNCALEFDCSPKSLAFIQGEQTQTNDKRGQQLVGFSFVKVGAQVGTYYDSVSL